MSLIRLYITDADSVLKLRVEQAVALAGDGRLLDDSECSREFREFISQVDLNVLARYAEQVLTTRSERGGYILQDLVNEIGRRIGFNVRFGRYQGVQGQVGNDGLWTNGAAALVVEVKTTDAFRINLSTLTSYADAYRNAESLAALRQCILIVVGRQDTGDLEAQIRGSRHAWDIRIISTEALVTLARLYRQAVDADTQRALQNALVPNEYTRLDHVVSLMHSLAFDVERSVLLEGNTDQGGTPVSPVAPAGRAPLPRATDEVRLRVAERLEAIWSVSLSRQSPSVYLTPSGASIVIVVSKRYDRSDQHYWYAFQSRWIERMSNQDSCVVLAMMDKEYVFCVPSPVAIAWPTQLNRTIKDTGEYWHMGLVQDGTSTYLLLPKLLGRMDLSPFRLPL